MTYSPCHTTNPDLPYNTTESVANGCGTCGGDRRLPLEAGKLERARQRAALVRRAAERAEAARLGCIADKEGVIG